MNRLFILIVILAHYSVVLSKYRNPFLEPRPEEPKIGPKGIPHNKTTSCEEFGRNARFNPDSVVNYHWFLFYYWDMPKSPVTVVFRTLSKKDMEHLRYLMLDRVADDFNWTARMLLMTDQRDYISDLLVEVGDQGRYHLYTFDKANPKGTPYQPISVRIKQVGSNKYIGIMICKDRTAYIFSKIQEVPKRENLQTEAAKLGYLGRKGKSYLYQGHEWMPINEADEFEFWKNYISPTELKHDYEEES